MTTKTSQRYPVSPRDPAYVQLNPTPFPSHLCLSCGCDPADTWEGNYRVGRDETRTLNAQRLCEDCQAARERWEARP